MQKPTVQTAGRWLAIAGVAALCLIALAGFSLAIYSAWLFHDLPDASQLAEYRPPTSTRVYAADGTLIGEFGKERRIFVPYDQIPPLQVKAFLAAEDRKFFEHGGIDVSGLGRAMGRDVLSLAQGRKLQGGSTITQQVAKNVLLSNDQTFGRKIKEAILARRIEQTLPKTRILELYLNEIWLGYRSYGVAAAAFNYFGKSLNELDLAQMAYLAALPKGPDNYHPIRHRTAAIARRNWIINEMVTMGAVTRAQGEAAMHEDLKVQTTPERTHYRDADYFLEETRLRAAGTLGTKADNGGLYIRTTLDSRLQTAARVALMKGLETYDHRHGWRGAWGHSDMQPGWEKLATAKSPPAERRAWKAAAVDRDGGSVHVVLPSGGAGELDPKDVAWAKAGKGLAVGDLVFVEPEDGGKLYNLRQVPIVNGAIVAHGAALRAGCLAMVGGYSAISLSKFNRATQAEAPAGVGVQALRLRHGAGERLHAIQRGARRADLPQRGRGQGLQPGELRAPLFGHDRLPQRAGLFQEHHDRAHRPAGRHEEDRRRGRARWRGRQHGAGARHGARRRRDHALRHHRRLCGVRQRRQAYPAAPDRTGGGSHGPCGLEGRPPRLSRLRQAYDGQESPRVPPDGTQVMDPVTAYQISLMLEGVTTRGTAAAVSSLGRHIAGQDRHHQRLPQRLVRRLHAGHGGGRVRRLRRRSLPR